VASWTAAVLLVGCCLAGPAAAQDAEIEALALLGEAPGPVKSVSTQSLQVYRLPFAYTLRKPQEGKLGLRLTFPVSFGAYELEASTDVGDFFGRLNSITVEPGIELLIPIRDRWTIKPFVEIGVSTSFSGDTATLYAAGVRGRGDFSWERLRLSLGAGARFASPRSDRLHISHYTTFSLGADARWPLGFEVADRLATGGAYAIVRTFPDLQLLGDADQTLETGPVYEVGFSFATEPALKPLGIEIAWIALGYRFGDLFSGVRLSLSFPF